MSEGALQAGSLYSRESEHAIIAALFGEQATEAFNCISLHVQAEHFYLDEARRVFTAFGDLVTQDAPIDGQLLANRLRGEAGFSEAVREAVQTAIAAPYASENVESYAKIVLEKHVARALKRRLDAVQSKVGLVGSGVSSDELVQQIESIALSIEPAANRNELLNDTQTNLTRLITYLQAKADGTQPGVKSGIEALDHRLNGLDPGQLIVIAGRPGMGKTVLGMQIADHHALHGPEDDQGRLPLVAVFSAEMELEKLLVRSMCSIGSIDHDRMRRGELTDDDYVRLTAAVGKYERAHVRIDPDSNITPAGIRAKVRMLEQREKRKVSLIVVDYLQLMSGDRAYENRVQEVSDISRSLKKMAGQFKCPVVALAQLNRSLENRADKRPVMADLRESGAIEQDADVIIFLYRDEVYNPDSDYKGMAEIIVSKGREGGTGMVPTQFEGAFQRFGTMPTGKYGYDSKYEN